MDTFTLHVADIKYEGKGIDAVTASTVAVGTKDSPLSVHVDSDTDWAAVAPSVASVVVAILVAGLTVKVQRNQIQANISTLRHHWMNELRSCSAELIKQMVMLINHMEQQRDYSGSPEFVSCMETSIILENKILLLLSRDDPNSKSIIDRIELILKSAMSLSYGADTAAIFKLLDELRAMLRIELEDAWDDIKKDLGVNTTFLGFKMIRKNK